jgi:hypothetical protein
MTEHHSRAYWEERLAGLSLARGRTLSSPPRRSAR